MHAPYHSPSVPSITRPAITRPLRGLAATATIAVALTAICVPILATVASPVRAENITTTSPTNDDTQLTREQWQQRIEAARERLRQRRVNGLGLRPATTERARERDNTERAMSDDLLQPGDMVSTPHGLMTFKGRKKQDQSDTSGEPANPPRRPEEDFVPAAR